MFQSESKENQIQFVNSVPKKLKEFLNSEKNNCEQSQCKGKRTLPSYNTNMQNISKRFKMQSPLPYIEQSGDIVRDYSFPSAMIVQLNNCVSRNLHPHSFSWNLAKKFNYANPYKHRLSGPYPNLAAVEYRPSPGTIQILHPPIIRTGPTFACLYGQYKMGKPDSVYYLNGDKTDKHYRFMSLYQDTYPHRLDYFNLCLEKLTEKLNSMYSIDSIIFPKYIGCGMAGGEWCDYQEIISRFCHSLNNSRPNVKVYIIEKK